MSVSAGTNVLTVTGVAILPLDQAARGLEDGLMDRLEEVFGFRKSEIL